MFQTLLIYAIIFFVAFYLGLAVADIRWHVKWAEATYRADYWYRKFVKHVEYVDQRKSEFGSAYFDLDQDDEDDYSSERWK